MDRDPGLSFHYIVRPPTADPGGGKKIISISFHNKKLSLLHKQLILQLAIWVSVAGILACFPVSVLDYNTCTCR